jgi:hypothetical protein
LFAVMIQSCEQVRKEKEDRANGGTGSRSRKKITRS